MIMSYLINMCFSSTVPDNSKVAKIISLFKGGESKKANT